MAAVILTVGLLVLMPPVGLRVSAQWPATPAWWTVPFAGLVLASAVTAATGRVEAAARLLWLAVVGGSLTLPSVLSHQLTEAPWLISLLFTSAAATCLVSSSLPRNLTALGVLIGSYLYLQRSDVWDHPHRVVVADAVFALAVAAIGYTVLRVLQQTETRVRLARDHAASAHTAARAIEAQAAADSQWDAYIHDELLAILTQLEAASADAARDNARRALDHAQLLLHAQVPAPRLPDGLLEATLSLHPPTETDLRTTPDALDVTADARRALVEAASEALRNIARHAWGDGAPGNSTLRLDHDAAKVLIVVSDEGLGFDPQRVDPARLGLQVSIHARMGAVGGRATVRSQAGRGTVVELRWPGDPT